MRLIRLGIMIGLLSVGLVRWHDWTAASDAHARMLIECESRGDGWVYLDGQCVAGSQRRRHG